MTDNVPSDWLAPYAEVLHANWCRALGQGCAGPSEFSDCTTEASRVMAVADQERAEDRAENERLIAAHQKQRRFADQNFENWQKAEAEIERLRSHLDDALRLLDQRGNEKIEEWARAEKAEATIARVDALRDELRASSGGADRAFGVMLDVVLRGPDPTEDGA